MTEPVRFTAAVELNGKTATGFEVPEDVLTRLGPGRRPAVRVTLGGHTYASTVGSMGGRAMLSADPAARATFDDLAPGQRKEWVRWVTEAKRAETRADRLARTVEALAAGRRTR